MVECLGNHYMMGLTKDELGKTNKKELFVMPPEKE